MAKKGGKGGKAKGKDKAKGKGKGKKDKLKKGKKGKPEPPKEEKKEEVKEDKPIEKTPPVIEEKIEEPCLFNCAQEKIKYRPNSYPGLLQQPKTMAVIGSECGSYDSLCKLIHSGFRCADRIYAMVPWGNYVIFRARTDSKMTYYLFDGCTCNVNRFRYLDLSCGTAGLLYFDEMHKIINYIIMSRARRDEIKNLKRCVVDDVCKEMYGDKHI